MKIKLTIICFLSILIGFDTLGQLTFRSDFCNLKLTKISTDKEYISPSYSYTYIVIGLNDENIGIHIFDTDNYSSPIILHNYKIVNEPLKDDKTVYFTKEGYFLTYDHVKNEMRFQYEVDDLKFDWHFEDLSISNETEYKNFTNTFNINNPNDINFLDFSENLIGY